MTQRSLHLSLVTTASMLLAAVVSLPRAEATHLSVQVRNVGATATATPTPTPTPRGNPTPTMAPSRAALPGVIECENFESGGEGIGYHDTDAANTGGALRPSEGVDIEAT